MQLCGGRGGDIWEFQFSYKSPSKDDIILTGTRFSVRVISMASLVSAVGASSTPFTPSIGEKCCDVCNSSEARMSW